MLVKSISHPMDDLLCQEMVRVNAGFGTGRVVKFSGPSNVTRASALGLSGIRWSKVKWPLVAGMD